MFDKDEFKNNLSIEEVSDLVAELGGEPFFISENTFIAKTICHNPFGADCKKKLYYYNNTKLFQCYTDCGDFFDIYELVCRVNTINHKKPIISQTNNWELIDAILYLGNYFNIIIDFEGDNAFLQELVDWDIFKKFQKNEQTVFSEILLPSFDKNILNYLPSPRILNWEREGITKETLEDYNIRFNPLSCGIVIPHMDMYENLVGIRERTLIEEFEQYGKYRPSFIGGKMYNHPLGYNLYGLNRAKDAIKMTKKAIVFEGEKSPMLYNSIFGRESNIAVASCGSSFTFYQMNLLKVAGAEEIIIAFDKQFKELGDEEFKRWTNKLINFHNKFSPYIKISFMFDKWGLLDYKDAPIDKGGDICMELYERRIII